MKISLFDPYTPTFTADMVDYWRYLGHEVKVDRYYDPELVVWGDLIYFFTADNNLLSATSPGDAILGQKFFDNKEIPWNMHDMDLTGKKIIVQPIDIEIWTGSHAHAEMWDLVDHCIFIAPHIRDMMMSDSRPQASNMKVHVVPYSINPNRWTFKNREPGFNIGVVAERWVSKGSALAIQLAFRLKKLDPRYRIFWLGKNNDYHWQEAYLQSMIKEFDLPITLEEEFVEDLDKWWEDKNYVLSCSMKEGFGANIAEAMAKGIKPLIHTFFGYEPIWGDSGWCWSNIDECIELITNNEYNSASYRQYLEDHAYTTAQMVKKIMNIIDA